MKLFDPRAALAEIEKRGSAPATLATSATQAPEVRPHVAGVADVAAPPVPKRGASVPQGRGVASDMPHGFAVGGSPKTWTGCIVSLDDWRRLSDWDKHGPNGRHWNGITKEWEVSE
jgi:hypothetical protein